jgi:hypothetical protein
MLQDIIASIQPNITALPFIDKYGGLVRTARRVIDASKDPSMSKMVRQAFPVSCDVTGEACWESGRYLDLVPNSKYKSLVYFEEIQPLSANGLANKFPKDIRLKFTAVVRLVAWFNMPELGQENCSISGAAFGSFYTLFEKLNKTRLNLPFVAHSEFVFRSQANKNENIFSKYTYDENSNLLFYPYDTLGMDYVINLYIDPKCLPKLEALDPVECSY